MQVRDRHSAQDARVVEHLHESRIQVERPLWKPTPPNHLALLPRRRVRFPEGEKCRTTCFDRFKNVWCSRMECPRRLDHPRRFDATLNPGGARIGTAEIHNQVEHMPELSEGLCIGQTFDDDVRVVLVVRLASNVLTETLETRIGAKIRAGCSPRHVRIEGRCGGRHSTHKIRQDRRAGRA